MADHEVQYRLDIKTSGDTSALKSAKEGVDDLTQSVKQLDAAQQKAADSGTSLETAIRNRNAGLATQPQGVLGGRYDQIKAEDEARRAMMEQRDVQAQLMYGAQNVIKQRAANAAAMEEELAKTAGLSNATKEYIATLGETEARTVSAAASTARYSSIIARLGRMATSTTGHMGGLGRSFYGFSAVATAAITGVVAGATYLYSRIEALGKLTTTVWQDMSKGAEAVRDKLEEMTLQQEAFERSIERIANRPQTAQEKTAIELQRIRELGSAEEKILEAQKEKALAIEKSKEDAGLITYRQFVLNKLAIDENYEQQKAAIQNRTQRAELSELYREHINTYTEQQEAQRRERHLAPTVQNLAGQKMTLEERIKVDKANAEAEQKKVQELTDELTTNIQQGGVGYMLGVAFKGQRTRGEIESDQNQHLKTLGDLKSLIARNEAHLRDVASEYDKNNEELLATKKALENSTERLRAIRNQLPTAAAKTAFDTNVRNILTGLGAGTAAAGAGGEIAKSEEHDQERAARIQEAIDNALGRRGRFAVRPSLGSTISATHDPNALPPGVTVDPSTGGVVPAHGAASQATQIIQTYHAAMEALWRGQTGLYTQLINRVTRMEEEQKRLATDNKLQ